MNNWHDSCEVFITAPQLWESLTVFRRITRGKVTHQIISLPTHGPQHICACGKFMCTSQTLGMSGFLVELVHAPRTHFPLWDKEDWDWFRQKKGFSRNGITIMIIIMIILFFYLIIIVCLSVYRHVHWDCQLLSLFQCPPSPPLYCLLLLSWD